MPFITNFKYPVDLSIKYANRWSLFSFLSWSGKKDKGNNSWMVYGLITDTWSENLAAMLRQCTALAEHYISIQVILPCESP